MKRFMVSLFAVGLLASLAFAPGLAGASNHGDMGGHGSRDEGAPITVAEASDRAAGFLKDVGLTALRVGDVVALERGFYAPVLDAATGAGAFELLVTLDGQSVHLAPGPSMMWNTQYSPMSGSQGAELHDRSMADMQNGGMMGGGMMMGNDMMSSNGMHGNDDVHDNDDMMNDAMHQNDMETGGGHMGGFIDPGQTLATPLTTDEAVARAQTWLDQAVPDATAVRPLAFPGYVTVLIEQDAQVFELLSIQSTTGAIWEPGWTTRSVDMPMDAPAST